MWPTDGKFEPQNSSNSDEWMYVCVFTVPLVPTFFFFLFFFYYFLTELW